MIIFGFGRTTFKDCGPDIPVMCERCRNDVSYHFIERKKWFTLFFIPILPYSSSKLVICPVCSNAVEMPAADWEARRQAAALAS